MKRKKRTPEEWAQFLANYLSGTAFSADPSDFLGWCVTDVGESDDEYEVISAWIVRCADPKNTPEGEAGTGT